LGRAMNLPIHTTLKNFFLYPGTWGFLNYPDARIAEIRENENKFPMTRQAPALPGRGRGLVQSFKPVDQIHDMRVAAS
ncbi:hypothetical protein, partial [Paracoccus yeei]|uniref:hypothetical protein n=1 Tax=Paracoccus yeei TaxID=147645 RepID=UPI001CD78B60